MATKRKKAPAKKKKKPTLSSVCRKVSKQEGINKATGQLKKGYKYKKGGQVVKVTSKK
jgi:hypothetical protein